MRGASLALGVKDATSSGGLTSWLSNLEWSTVRWLIFVLTFGVVGVYQYFRWKSNRASTPARDPPRKGQLSNPA